MTLLCRICNEPIAAIREPSTTIRFGVKVVNTSRCKAVHATETSEPAKIPLGYLRQLRLQLEDTCQRERNP